MYFGTANILSYRRGKKYRKDVMSIWLLSVEESNGTSTFDAQYVQNNNIIQVKVVCEVL